MNREQVALEVATLLHKRFQENQSSFGVGITGLPGNTTGKYFIPLGVVNEILDLLDVPRVAAQVEMNDRVDSNPEHVLVGFGVYQDPNGDAADNEARDGAGVRRCVPGAYGRNYNHGAGEDQA